MREEGPRGKQGPEAGWEVRRAAAIVRAAAAILLLAAATAQAAPPTLGAVTATNIQGVSALLKGSVDPGGLATTYSFEYVDQASFEASVFAGATSTPASALAPVSGARPARAAVAGLAPDTTYHYRLRAHNSAGDPIGAPATFTTTHGFGFAAGDQGFTASAVADGGAVATAAGSHPNQLAFRLGFNQGGEFEGQPAVPFPDGDLRDLRIQMPPGLILNPAVLPRCGWDEFHTPRSSPFEASRSGEECPDETQLGTVEVKTSLDGGQTRRFGVFNLEAPPGVPAQIGFAPFGTPIVIDVDLQQAPDGSYALSLHAANFPQTLDVSGLELALWGIPWGVSHDDERGDCLNELESGFPWAKCSLGPPRLFPRRAYVTLPSTCSGPLAFTASASAWQQPATVAATALSRDSGGSPAPLNCDFLGFASHPTGLLTSKNASTASGFKFLLANEDAGVTEPGLRAPSQVRNAVLALPEGVTINPSLGAGLGVCTPGQYAAETAFSAEGEGCPDAAKIGDFTVRTPLFSDWFEGAIYLAQPDDPGSTDPGAENPFDTLLAIYLVAKMPARGIQIKVAGKIVPDPRTGRLVVTFEGLPQLPYENLEVNLRATQRAPLITPAACGSHTTQIDLTPWGGVVSTFHGSSVSQIAAGIGGGRCPNGTAVPFAPGAVAGGVNSNVGYYTPYFVHLSRQDTEQEITSYSLVLPKGITGKLAGIPFCPDAAIAAARTRPGAAETAQPSCPAASQVGRTVTGYGVGAALAYAPGRVYLAGPYHGQPLSLVTVNAATIGPFDLGTIVIRSAFAVDPSTAQLRIDSRASDPIPHIIDGIPLHLRDVRIYMDRPEFTRNPTSCEPSALVSTLTGSGTRFDDPSDDPTATVATPFQLLNCLTLGFRPKLGLRLRGGSRRGDYPSLRATFASRGARDANLKQIAVTMPHALFLAQNHIRAVCTREQFAADRCPPGSVYGSAVAHTPLFDEPLRGPIYLRSSSHRLPDLVASLHSGAIRIVLEGKIGPAKQGIRAQFEGLPDAPIDRFVMTLNGGDRGLLVNSSNICASPPTASVKALGQNNVGRVFTSTLRGQCKAHHKRKGKR
jgi:hypothetical protein